MLVLTRRIGEEIVIDGAIRVIVLDVRGDRIRLGVCAPVSVRVDRQEVHERRWVDESPKVAALGDVAP
jgi:carbon storage regulator